MRFKAAVNHGYAIELDVHLSKDGKVVIHHDSNIKKLTGVDLDINHATYQQIKKHKILDSQEHSPTLNKVLDLVDGQVPVYIEIKNYDQPGSLESQVKKIVDHYNGDVAVISFNPLVIDWFKTNAPYILVGQTSTDNSDMSKTLRAFLENKKILNYKSDTDFVIYNINFLTHINVNEIAKNKPLIVYDVNDQITLDKGKILANNIIFDNIRPKLSH